MSLLYNFFFSIVFVFLLSCDERDALVDNSFNFEYKISDIKPFALDRHTAEGGLARLDNGSIIVLYRKDCSFSHVGNKGRIVGKVSNNNGDSWSKEFNVYDSPYDDRNLIIGTLNSGEIIIVFRRYDNANANTIDSGFITSKDGLNWSEYNMLSGTENTFNQPFGIINSYNGTTSFLIAFGKGIIRKISSTDSFKTDLKQSIIIHDSSKKLEEPFEVFLKDGKSILLCRNGNGEKGQPSFFQYSSFNGEDYDFIGSTNIFNDFDYSVRCPVSMSYDKENDVLEVMANSRFLYNTSKNLNNELRIYRQSGSSVFESSKKYVLDTVLNRPLPSFHWFYGYPKNIELNKNEKLYIISDAKIHDESLKGSHLQNEDANIYSFKITRERK